MADTPTLELRIQDNSEKAIRGLQSLASSLRELKGTLEGGLGFEKVIGDLDKLSAKFNNTFTPETVENINKVTQALEKLQKVSDVKLPDLSYGNNNQPISPEMKPIDSPIEFAKPDLTAFDQTNDELAKKLDTLRDQLALDDLDKQYGSIDALEAKYQALQSELGMLGAEAGNANEEVGLVAKSIKEAGEGADGASGGFSNFGKTLGKIISPLDKLIKAFNRILFYRVIRSVIKEISKGLGEGIANVRAYSKAINGSFNTAMTNAENALFKMKNSIGAALAPAIEAVIPVVQTLVSWFISLVNVANQFFALLTGKTEWTRAIDASAASFEKQKKAASGAAKEVKNLLAGFDELNIIQSESGGNGGGSGAAAAIDYTKAFEQVTQFDDKVKSLVKWIKENTDLIKKTVGAISTAIFGWRVSEEFEGILGKLGAIIAFGGTVFLEWELTSKFSGEYLKSGDLGWLVADVLTAVVGAYLGKKLAQQVFGEGTGAIGVSIMLTVSALADIVASLRNADVSALSKENIINTLLASIKMGAAGVFLAKYFNFATADALKIGGGAALVTFGAAMGIKATAEAINSDDFSNEDFIKAKALSSISMGAGAALLGKKLFDLSAGKSIEAGIGVALVTFGAYTAIKAIADAVKSDDFTEVNLAKLAESSAELGIGAGITYNALGGDIKGSFELAGGVALVTFGVASGVQAVLRAEKVGYDKAFLGDLAKSSLGIGAGSALAALALGASAGVAGIIGGLGAVITVGVIVGVSSILRHSKKRDAIKWGDIAATEAEIQAYVTQKMFSVDVEANINLAKTKVTATTQAQESLKEQTTELFTSLNVLRLGVDTDKTLEEIKKQALGESGDGSGGIVKAFKDYVESQEILLKTSFTLIPIKDAEGKDITAEYLKSGIAGWNMLEEAMTKMGEDVSEHLVKAADDSLDAKLREFQRNAATKLLETMARVSQAVSSGNLEAQAMSNLTLSLNTMDEPSAKEAIRLYSEYKKELEAGYKDIFTQAAMSYMSMANGLDVLAEQAMKDGNAELAKKYSDQAEEARTKYKNLIKDMPKQVADAVKTASAQGQEIIRGALEKVYGDAIKDYSWGNIFGDFMKKNITKDKFGEDEIVPELIKRIQEHLLTKIGASKEMFEAAGIDIFSMIGDSAKSGMVTRIAEAYGLDVAEQFAKAIGSTVPEEVRKSIEEAQKKAEEKALLDRSNARQEKAWSEDKALAAKAAETRAELEETRRALLERGANAQEDSWREDKQLSAQVALARENVRIKYEQLVAEIADKKKYLESVNKQIEDAEERLRTKDPLGMDNLRRRGAMDELYGYEKQGGGRTGGLKGQKSETEIELENLNAALITVQKQAESLGVTLDETISGNSVEVEEVDMSPIVEPVETAADDIHKSTVSIIKDFKNLSSLDFSREMSTIEWMLTGGGSLRGRRMVMKAEGGFVGTGDMFIAREAGPELVGRIGSRTAVANNDQIVQGVASGVASGQAEQNNLLRQQNDILRQLLSKSGRTEAVPSADWGQFIKRSSEMYATNAGW